MIQLSVRWHVPEVRLELEHVFCRAEKNYAAAERAEAIL